MARQLFVPVIVALVAACSGGSGSRDGGGIAWGDRDGIWGACYFIDKQQCVDFLEPESIEYSGQIKKGCTDEDGLWSDFTCPETQLGSCEVVAGQQILRYYSKTQLDKGKYACDYMGATWTQP